MIEGLKVTIDGTELQALCSTRAAHHRERVEAYQEQLKSLQAAAIEGMEYSGGDPKKALADKAGTHETQADEMTFIAAHIDLAETYILDLSDLEKLGIVQRRYGF